jgi:cell division protein FtsW
MARKLKSDKLLFLTALLLMCTSVVMVYSASAPLAQGDAAADPFFYVKRQVLWSLLGLAGLAVAMRIDYRAYRNDAFVLGLVGVVGLGLVAVLFNDRVNGARRWLLIGGLGIQPSELAKVVCVLFTALMLERRMHRIDQLRYSLLPIGLVVGPVAWLIYREPDLGTAVSLLAVVAIMVFAAGLRVRHIGLAALLGVPALGVAAVATQYRMDRLVAWLDPWAVQYDEGYQAVQAQIAVGSGGIFGRGLTEGVLKLFYLPYPQTDFIYAVIAEELGIIGATAVLIGFCLIAWRGMRIAVRSDDAFGAFLALGITAMICVQALINISVVLTLLPTKGIPLPLVSFGGSSLLVSMGAIGVLLNISQHETVEA